MKRDAYARALAALPVSEAERGKRATELGRFLAAGFPTTANEAWRYTDLGPLAERGFGPASPGAAVPDLSGHRLDGCERVVFVNGIEQQALALRHPRQGAAGLLPAQAPRVRDDDSPVLALNRALAMPGLHLHLPAGYRQEHPLHVLLVTVPDDPAGMTHLAHAIHLDAGASATVVLHHVGGSGEHFATHALEVSLGPAANLTLIRIQDDGEGTTQLFRADADVGRDARLRVVTNDFGGALVRNDWNVALTAPGAAVNLDGLYAPRGRSHVDNHTRIDHLQPHGTSREHFRGIVGERARAVFNGRIVVHPDAQKTDSEQRVANLLLSPQAEVNAKPELEINADDVRCAHGATFGQLDETAIFYLRSRGLPANVARALLTYTFGAAVLAGIPDVAIREHVERRLLAQLPQELAGAVAASPELPS